MEVENFIIHKPFGYLSQFVYDEKRPKKLLGDLYQVPVGTMAIGRLDEDSEGLLFLTTGGKTSQYIRCQSIEKEYHVQLDGEIGDVEIQQLKEGVLIGLKGEKYLTKPCNAFLINQPLVLPERSKAIRDERHGPTSWLSITLTEGKFRQVRKMCAAVGFPVLRLIRVRIGNELLTDVPKEGIKQVTQFKV